MGAHALFDQSIERVDDLRRLYALCERVQATEQVKQSWAAYIKVNSIFFMFFIPCNQCPTA